MNARTLLLVTLLLASAACGRKELVRGGVFTTRSVCPQVGIPAATGDITLFSPEGRADAAAIDVVATITNLRSRCSDSGPQIVSTASFAVVATRRDAGPARTVLVPFFDVAMQGGTQVVAKRVGQIALTFPAGGQRAVANSEATIRVNRAATALPEDVRQKLIRERRAGETEAAIDPMTDPAVRAAVARATFEHLIGFQLTPEQLRYNATR